MSTPAAGEGAVLTAVDVVEETADKAEFVVEWWGRRTRAVRIARADIENAPDALSSIRRMESVWVEGWYTRNGRRERIVRNAGPVRVTALHPTLRERRIARGRSRHLRHAPWR